MDNMRKKPGEWGWWKIIRRRRRSTNLMMTWEGTAEGTCWGGWEVNGVGMTAETTTKSEAIY